MKQRLCELCNANAAVFCPSDAAFLCRNCDVKVHEANFLVARHVRRAVGVDSLCPSCDEDDLGSLSSTTSPANKVYSSSSSSSSSSISDCGRKRRLMKAESVFNNWCGKLGIEERSREACRAMKACTDRVPLRVCLAASMWLGLRLTLRKKPILMRLQEISGVPAKIILAAASKFDRRSPHLQEGWAES